MPNYKIFSLLRLMFLTVGLMFGTNLSAQNSQATDGDFAVKGFHLDLRIQVITPQALKDFATQLAGFGINTLVMEWEASYPYQKHATISNQLAYTRDEVESFIRHCENLGIDVVPLQQCFGHVEYILRHERYSHLKEDRKDISQICPLKTEGDSLLFSDLFADMISLHHSKYLHIGGDETYLLGHCAQCSAKAQEEGKSKLFVDYMKMICETVVSFGKTPVMWADILLKYPEAANELPKETIFIDWNYGWRLDHFGDIGSLQKKGFTFWGSPAIRSHPDNWYVTCWEKHLNNQRDFVPYARKAGYQGLVMTSWSTSGLYGFIWDVGYEVVDMIQIRNTYPLSGFRMLVAAYGKALSQKEPIEPKEFVIEYAIERFGLTAEEGQKLWQALTIDPELIVNGKPQYSATIAEMRSQTKEAKTILYQLHPTKNEKEFEHFRMMIDLREYYLAFKEIKARYNSDNYTLGDAEKLIPGLEKLLAESKVLDQRFYDLNKGFLHDAEIHDQNQLRNLDLNNLYHRVIKMRK